MVKVINIKDIDLSKLEYHDPVNGKFGGKSMRVTHRGDKIILEVSRCDLPFGVNEYESQYGTKYSVDLSLNEGNKDFESFLQKFDDLNVEKGIEKSSEWFSKDLDRDIVDQLYKRQLRKSNGYNPLMRAKIINNAIGPLCTVFDNNKNIIDLKSVKKHSEVSAVIELTGIYFVAKEFGVTWKLLQLMVHPKLDMSSYAFVDDSDDDTEDAEPI